MSKNDLSRRITNLSPEQRNQLEQKLSRQIPIRAKNPLAARSDKSAPVPLSTAQRGLWFLYLLQPHNPSYHIPMVLKLEGELDKLRLERAISTVVQRHEVLRTTFAAFAGEPVQVIHPPRSIKLDVIKTSLNNANGCARNIARRPFDLNRNPPIRFTLLQFTARESWLLVVAHHIVADGWSLNIIQNELIRAYTDDKHAWTDLPLQYADFAAWERGNDTELGPQLIYWRNQLENSPSSLDLPTDRLRPAQISYAGARTTTTISLKLIESLQCIANRNGATLFMVLLSALNILINRYSGQNDVSIGTPVAGRPRSELENLVGLFINTLVLRNDLSGDPTFLELLGRVRKTTLDALSNQDIPFDKLVEELKPPRDLSRSPFFQVMLVLQNQPMASNKMGVVDIERDFIEMDTSTNDLTFYVRPLPDGYRVVIEYSTDLFESETMARMANHLNVLLEGVVAAPETPVSQLPLLTSDEREQLLSGWNSTNAEYPSDRGVHDLFAAQAQATPAAVAVTYGGQSLSYAELDARSNRLAHYLRDRGIRAEMLVGIYLERSLDMLVALLGVLKSGAAYVPLDPSFPVERLEFMLQDAQVSLLLSESQLQSVLPGTEAPVVYLDQERENIAGHSAEDLSEAIAPQQLAYVIYTSGSTGKPKGVQIPHQPLTNFLLSMAREPGLKGDDVLLAVTTLSFDIAGLELYLPLLVGAQVVIASREEAADGQRLAQCIADSRASVMQATPASWRLLFESGWSGQPGLKVLCGGESLPRDLAEQILAADMELWNLYGPTETTIWSAIERVETGSGPVPIGRPIANTQIYVLDQSLGLLPIGATGELYIGGDGLALGYLNRAELTAERFVASPFKAGERLYRTGDLARYYVDGRLEVLGRIDTQVKVRGYRIELGEIEAVLAAHPNVQEAVVVVREEVAGDKRIVAYVIPVGDAVEATELRSHLQRSMPDYMVPTTFVELESYPLTPNGKVDRKALPAPEQSRSADGNGFVAPRTETELALAEIWSQVLGVESVGINDDFFELGGHSLLAVRLVASIEAALGKQLPLATMFQSRTIKSLSGHIDGHSGEKQKSTCVALREGGTKPPFFAGGSHPRYLDVAGSTDKDRPFYRLDVYALQSERIARGLKPLTNIEDMAEHFIDQIRMVQPQGPYYLGGGCEGGYVAFEMARQLKEQDEDVACLVVWLVPAPDAWRTPAVRYAAFRVFGEVWGMIRKGALRKFDRQSLKVLMQHEFIEYKIYKAIEKYKPTTPYFGNMILARHFDPEFPGLAEESMGWKDCVTGGVEVHELPGQHRGWLDEYWEQFSQLLDNCLSEARIN